MHMERHSSAPRYFSCYPHRFEHFIPIYYIYLRHHLDVHKMLLDKYAAGVSQAVFCPGQNVFAQIAVQSNDLHIL